jgi:hypothetical protein
MSLFTLVKSSKPSKKIILDFAYNNLYQSQISVLSSPSTRHADVVELVDTLDLGSSASRRESSSLSIRTTYSSYLPPLDTSIKKPKLLLNSVYIMVYYSYHFSIISTSKPPAYRQRRVRLDRHLAIQYWLALPKIHEPK